MDKRRRTFTILLVLAFLLGTSLACGPSYPTMEATMDGTESTLHERTLYPPNEKDTFEIKETEWEGRKAYSVETSEGTLIVPADSNDDDASIWSDGFDRWRHAKGDKTFLRIKYYGAQLIPLTLGETNKRVSYIEFVGEEPTNWGIVASF